MLTLTTDTVARPLCDSRAICNVEWVPKRIKRSTARDHYTVI